MSEAKVWTEEEELKVRCTVDTLHRVDGGMLARAFATIDAAREEAKKARDEAMRQAADVCEREARACYGHAESFAKLKTKGRKTIAEAHAMAGQQSRACGAYILALLDRPVASG